MQELQELIKVQELLQIEKEEDFLRYRHLMTGCSITERKKNGLTWYPVVINSTEIGFGEYLVLEVERTSDFLQPHQLSAGKSVSVFTNHDNKGSSSTITGVVKQLSGNKIKLALNTDELPEWIDEGKLGIDLLFDENSYREMEFALKKVINAENNRLAELRDILYGLKKATFEPENKDINIPILNTSQNEALRKIAAAKDVAIIHGPPGTGKTTTLVQAIKYTLLNEKQVLVCSPSNVAVDLLTEKLVKEGVNVLRLGNPARVSEEVLNNTLDARIMNHSSYKEIKLFIKQAEEYRRMAGKYKRTFGKAEREQRQQLFMEARNILKEARNLENYILEDQLDKAQVITCTPVAASGKLLRDKFFKTVFFDEAAQALEPMSWIPITRAGRVIFAGDHYQLPPTVKSKKAEAGGLKITLFEKCMERQKVDVMLKVQYRMHDHIMEFSNKQFYGGNLLAADSVRDRLLCNVQDVLLLNKAFEFIDTAGCSYNESVNPETLSIANSDEASLLLLHFRLLMESYYSSGKKDKPTVGIISPYKEQVQYISDYITTQEEFEPYRQQVAVKTIDGFQGQEKDIIYISMVRSNEAGEIGFLSDTRRMNVALTRAKKKLVVIGDSATLSHHPFYKSFLDHVEKADAYKSAWEFIV